MNSYGRYQGARNAAWECLIENQIYELPIKVSSIAKQYKIKLLAYEDAQNLIQRLKLEQQLSEDGFCVNDNGNFTIYYNGKMFPPRLRFTLAHELGHFVFGHRMVRSQGVEYTVKNREPPNSNDPLEREADMFAARLLAPSCVLWGLQIHTVEEIMKVCGLSYQAAVYRKRRMDLLYAREQKFIKEQGKSCFLLHPLERQVYEQFKGFIEKERK